MTLFTTFGYMVDAIDHSLTGVWIQTHSGVEHSDDATGAVILAGVGVGRAQILRSLAPEAKTGAEIVVDIGRVYYPCSGKFDHHQVRGGTESSRLGFAPTTGAGLLWDRYGHDFIKTHYDSIGGFPADTTDLVRRIHSAVATAAAELVGEDSVKTTIVEQPGNIAILDQYRFGTMAVCQAANAAGSTIRRLVFPDVSGQWRVQIVEGTESLPSEWVGKTPEEFKTLTGIDGFVYCHTSGFIAGNLTKEGAIEMAHIG